MALDLATVDHLLTTTHSVRKRLDLKREVFGLAVSCLLFRFYEPARAYLSAQGFRELPDVHGASLALAFAGSYLLWYLLRHAVALEHQARPKLSVRILDPSQRYDTYVAIGERLLRLYHLEVENRSSLRMARNVAVLAGELPANGGQEARRHTFQVEGCQRGRGRNQFEATWACGVRAMWR